MTLEQAVQQLTQVPARLYGLRDRGELREGAIADLVVFDPEEFRDVARFGAEAMRYAEGVDYLFVNGTLVIDDGSLIDVTPGRVLKRGGQP